MPQAVGVGVPAAAAASEPEAESVSRAMEAVTDTVGVTALGVGGAVPRADTEEQSMVQPSTFQPYSAAQ